MGPALPSQLCEKQRKGQSCTLSPALRGDTNTLSKNFSNSSGGEGKPKDNSLSRVLFLCKGPNPPHPTGEEEEMWDGGAALARSAETSTTGGALLTTGWGSSGCPGSHSHQNPPESTRILQNPAPLEGIRVTTASTPSHSHIFHKERDLASNVQFQEVGVESENP